MALEGTLRDFSLADIFQLIGLQRKTGVLTLRSAEDVVTVSFLEGRVVGADSLNKRLEDRLGQVLIKTNLVSQNDLDRALKTQMETLERLGRILLRNQALSRDDLRKALEAQILQIIFRVFRWQDGDYHFSQETSIDYDQELVAPMAAESILMEGARMLDEWPIIEKKIAHRGIVFVRVPASRNVEIAPLDELEALADFDFELEKSPEFPSPTGRVRVSQLEADTLALVDGVSSVEDILKRSPVSEFETCKALYNLLTRSLIREATREEATRARESASGATKVVHPHARVPWLAFLVAPLLAASLFLSPRNPLNPILGPGPKLLPRLAGAISWCRMAGVWEILHASSVLTGNYPETLSDLARDGFVGSSSLRDQWGNPYRYVLREQSVLIGGSTKSGAPDPNLLLIRTLSRESQEESAGPGATLVEP